MKALAGLFGGGGSSAPEAPKPAAQALSTGGTGQTTAVAAPASGGAPAGRVTLGVASDEQRRKRAAVPGLGL